MNGGAKVAEAYWGTIVDFHLPKEFSGLLLGNKDRADLLELGNFKSQMYND